MTVGSLQGSGAKADIHLHVGFVYQGQSYTDDDDQMPSNQANATRFTSHAPESTAVSTETDGSTNTQGPPAWTYISSFSISVTDCVSDMMPALYANEDFTVLPPTLTINGQQYPFKHNDDGTGWTTDGSGIFSTDFIGCYNLPQAYPHSGSAAYSGTHAYFGGTHGTQGVSAINIGAWNINVWTDKATQTH